MSQAAKALIAIMKRESGHAILLSLPHILETTYTQDGNTASLGVELRVFEAAERCGQ